MATRPPSDSGTTDPRDDAFIREVDEAYREDELKKFVQTYGRWVLLGVTAGLIGLGGYLWWQADKANKAEALSEQFVQALEKADTGGTTEAVEALGQISAGNHAAYAALAKFTEAGVAVSGGENDKAAGLYKQVSDNVSAPQSLRDAALIKYLRLSFETLSPAEIVKQTAPYMAGDNVWFPVAGELAALAHVKAGEGDKAGPIFYRIAADTRAPASLRARAEQMAATLGQDVTKLAEASTDAPDAQEGAQGQ